MVDGEADAAAGAQLPPPPPPALSPFPSAFVAVPGPQRRSRRFRWIGPAWCTGMLAAFTISAYAWTLRPVASERAPGAPWEWQLARAGFAACAAVALVCLWVTYAADPGFLMPSLTPDAEFAAVSSGRASGEALGWRVDGAGQWRRGDGSRFCTTCHIWRPQRAAHCSECGFCVARHDHHCGVMGTCVAQRNHAPFATFLCAAVAGSVVLLAATAAQLHAMRWPWTAGAWRRWETYPHAVLLVFYAYPCLLWGFAGMHVAFLCRDTTTHEMIKRRRAKRSAAAAAAAQPQEQEQSPPRQPEAEPDAASAACGPTRVFCLAFRSRRAFEAAWEAVQHDAAPPDGAPAGDVDALPA